MGKRLTDEQKREKYDTVAECIIDNHQLYHDKPRHRQTMINGFRNILFDSPRTFSGFVSEKGQHLKANKLVKEHFYPRQASAYKMFEMLDAGVTKDELINFIKMVCQVHYVTKDENEDLKTYQKIGSGYNTWEEQYTAAGIKLVPRIPIKPGRKPKK